MKHNWLRVICIAVAVVCLLAAFAMPVGAAQAIPTQVTGATVPTGAAEADRPTPTAATGWQLYSFTLSEGNWWIIGIGTAVIVGVLVAMVVIWRKRK